MKLAENLKKAVLQAAMQGKLTRQLKTDSSVDDLLQKIAEEKARLIAEGKIKKERGESLPLAPERKRSSATPSPRGTPPKTPDNSPQVLEENSISSRQRNARFEPIPQEEIPFEIPENWRWVKVGNVLSIARGGSPRPITSYLTTSDDGYNWIKIGDSEIGAKYINKTAEKIIKEGLYKTRLVHKGDLLLSNSMSFGRPYILNIDGCIHDGWLVLHDYSESLNKEFLYFVFSSNVLKEQFFGKVSGAVVKNLNSDKVADTIIPLPPIEEQQRIVEKLNQILPLIDEYGKEEDALVALSQNLPEEIKKSVLQAAMQGKLTQQQKTDSSVDELLKKIAKEKAKLIEEGKIKKDTTKAGASGRALSEITEEEIPFEIPENWRWVKVGNVLSIARGGSPRPITSYLTTSDDGYNWIKIGDSEIGAKYINKTAEKIIKEGLYKTRLVHKGDLLLSNSMSFGRPYILNIDGCIHDGWLVLHDYSESLNKEFLYFVFSSNVLKEQFFGKVSGAVVKNLNSDKVADTIIPLPPIEEQQRIVEKLNQILPLIDEYGKEEDALVALSQNFPEDIKKSVLQSAMQGKLTRQQQTDSSVDDLLKKIAEEKARLIAEGKIKKDTTKAGASGRALAEITQEEIPFEIPENWRWCRLGELFVFINGDRGKNYPAKTTLKSEGVIPFISAVNFSNYTLRNDNLLYLTEKQFDSLGSGKLKFDDIVLCIRGSLGKFCRYPLEI